MPVTSTQMTEVVREEVVSYGEDEEEMPSSQENPVNAKQNVNVDEMEYFNEGSEHDSQPFSDVDSANDPDLRSKSVVKVEFQLILLTFGVN